MAVRRKRVLTAAQKAAKAARAKRRRQTKGSGLKSGRSKKQLQLAVDIKDRQRARKRASKKIAQQNLAMNRKSRGGKTYTTSELKKGVSRKTARGMARRAGTTVESLPANIKGTKRKKAVRNSPRNKVHSQMKSQNNQPTVRKRTRRRRKKR